MKGRKQKGTRKELRSVRFLEKAGFRVIRSAGSFQEFDLVAIRAEDMQLVQVKSGHRPTNPEMERMRNFPTPPNCRKYIHIWHDYSRSPEIEQV